MGRVSQAQARQNREQVVDAAARLFRERGIQGVSVAEVMAAAGLTHGGFYKQFASKEALVAEAAGQAFDHLDVRLSALGDDHEQARRTLIDYYLSPEHRDDPGDGCPTAGLVTDMAREAPDSPAREIYAGGVESFGHRLATGPDGGEDLAAVSMMVGAILLARATSGDLSERILHAVREALR
jgi:TetR/AcrR family transcriptional regulator, transcriptional repressor for nem operon